MRLLFYILLILIILLAGPAWVLISNQVDLESHWQTADRSSVGIAPNPETFKPAIVQVYAARAFNWRGLFGIHTWIATKEKNASTYTIYEIMGWNQFYHKPVLVISHGMPDRKWYGHSPWIIKQITGQKAEQAIIEIAHAVQNYPYPNTYRLWPGPNSNTFIAYVLRHTPSLQASLPVTAIGKDYLSKNKFISILPSQTGWQISFYGLLGLAIGLQEGIEFNLLGLSFGIDILHPALKLPGIGRVGKAEPQINSLTKSRNFSHARNSFN